MYEKIKRYYPPWLDLIPVFLLIMAFYYTASYYDQLPMRMPTHFGVSGQPDAWSAKDFWSVYLGLVIATPVWFSMALINYFLIIKPEDPGEYINLTKKQKEKLGPEQLEAIRRVTARGVILINITLVSMIVLIQDGSIKTALGLQNGLGYYTYALVAALIIESLWLTIKTISMTYSK